MPSLVQPPDGLFAKGIGFSPALAPVRLPRDDLAHPHTVEWWYFVAHLEAQDGSGLWFTANAIVLKQVFLGVLPMMVGLARIIDHQQGPRTLFQRAQHMVGGYEDADDPVWMRFVFDSHRTGIGSSGSLVISTGAEAGTQHFELVLGGPEEASLRLRHRGDAVILGDRGMMTYQGGTELAYYARTNMLAEGTVVVDGVERRVNGPAWMEHQWGAAAVREARWKYLAIHLNDGEQWLFFRVEDRGELTVFGVRHARSGGGETIGAEQISVEDVRSHDGYAVDTRITVGGPVGLDLLVQAIFDEQEVDPWIPNVPSFWEGVCRVTGQRHHKPVSGLAMTEMRNP